MQMVYIRIMIPVLTVLGINQYVCAIASLGISSCFFNCSTDHNICVGPIV